MNIMVSRYIRLLQDYGADPSIIPAIELYITEKKEDLQNEVSVWEVKNVKMMTGMM